MHIGDGEDEEEEEEEDEDEEECASEEENQVSVLKNCFLAMVDTLSKQVWEKKVCFIFPSVLKQGLVSYVLFLIICKCSEINKTLQIKREKSREVAAHGSVY